MKAGKGESLELLRKFPSERTLIEVSMAFPAYRARFRARVRSVTADEIRLISDDTTSELALSFKPWMEFLYGDGREVDDDSREFEGTLVIVFRLGDEGEEAYFISLTEVAH